MSLTFLLPFRSPPPPLILVIFRTYRDMPSYQDICKAGREVGLLLVGTAGALGAAWVFNHAVPSLDYSICLLLVLIISYLVVVGALGCLMCCLTRYLDAHPDQIVFTLRSPDGGAVEKVVGMWDPRTKLYPTSVDDCSARVRQELGFDLDRVITYRTDQGKHSGQWFWDDSLPYHLLTTRDQIIYASGCCALDVFVDRK